VFLRVVTVYINVDVADVVDIPCWVYVSAFASILNVVGDILLPYLHVFTSAPG
jgi:hypothetical protein